MVGISQSIEKTAVPSQEIRLDGKLRKAVAAQINVRLSREIIDGIEFPTVALPVDDDGV